MCRAGRPANYVDVPSNYGHDSFRVEQEPVGKLLESFIGREDER
jgi:homoserine acetyltransferase